jgi:hypothetical protein
MAGLRNAIFAILIALVCVEAKLLLQRNQVPDSFRKLSLARPDQLHEFRLALKQRNLNILEETLLDLSNPDSQNYGKWWTNEQILDLIAPSNEDIRPVIEWLKENGVDRIDLSGRDFIKVSASIGTIEKLFRTRMHNYKNEDTGKIVTRAFGEIHVPDHLHVIDMVLGLTELVPKSEIEPVKHTEKRSAMQDPMGYIYPGILRLNYYLPASYWVHPRSSICVVNFQDLSGFSASDLGVFNSNMNESTHVDKIVGRFSGNSPDSQSNLQVQYGSALSLNTTFWFWTVDKWLYEFTTDLFTTDPFPLVVVMGWGWPEDLQCQIVGCGGVTGSYSYVERLNTEFMKLGAKGITLLASAGDNGAPGVKDKHCKKGILSTMFPASSPWVTSVGATALGQNPGRKRQQGPVPECDQVQCAESSYEVVSTYPDAYITTGGGFSQVSPVPAYQKAAVDQYLTNSLTELPPAHLFNRSNRAYPDISATGHDYLVQIGVQGFIQVDSSSVSATVVGSMISLWNSFLFNNRKDSLGFVNPLLYKIYAANPNAFTDINSGSNVCTKSCCGAVGYNAVPGYDVVSGIGTPLYSPSIPTLKKILKI